MEFDLDLPRNEISFAFDSRAYHKEALYGAALVFTSRCYAYLKNQGRSGLLVTLQGKQTMDEDGLTRLAGEFHNELLSQTLRWMVAKHNKGVKGAIITQALYAAHSLPKGNKRD